MRLLACIFVLAFSTASYGNGLLQSAISSYSSWKMIEDGYKKDCEKDAVELSTSVASPKTMVGASLRNLRQLHIPTALSYKSTLDADTKSKLESIDKAAKTKALEVLKVTKKIPLEIAEKSSGLGLVHDAELIPQDFLKKFDYKKSCECVRNTQNIARDEAEYNKLTVQEFMIRTDHNKAKCFVQNASL